MGFFSSILAPILKVGAGVFLGEAAATTLFPDEPEKAIESAATAAVGGAAATPAGTAKDLLFQAAQATIAGVPAPIGPVLPSAIPVDIVAPGGLKNVVMTTVRTIAPNGTVVRTETMKGRPFLMKKDIIAAKRVFKLSSKLHAKLPKRTLKQSEMAKLNEAILDETKRRLTGPSCPPKC